MCGSFEFDVIEVLIYDMLNFLVFFVVVEGGCYVFEFFYGLIFVFKDVGVCFMVCLMCVFKLVFYDNLMILVVMSGDIGSVVVYVFVGVEGFDVVVFFL